MHALVVYESMYGNTHIIAERIADGLRHHFDVVVVPAAGATPELVTSSQLLVCGGPTHAHSMSSRSSRRAAIDTAAKPRAHVTLDPSATATESGLRDWFQQVPSAQNSGIAASFDTRFAGPSLLTGRASMRIARLLQRRGYRLAVRPESFLVDKANHLLDGEGDRAESWGAMLALAAFVHAPGRSTSAS